MRHWINLAPALVFFAVYIIKEDFHFATAALMVAVILQIIALKILKQRIGGVEWATVALVVIFGGITLLLRDVFYLQIKTTVINWLFALTLLIADFGFSKNLTQLLFGKFFNASAVLWRRISIMLSSVFAVVGLINLAVIYNFSEETWVFMKTFVYPSITFVSLLGIIAYLSLRANIKHEKL